MKYMRKIPEQSCGCSVQDRNSCSDVEHPLVDAEGDEKAVDEAKNNARKLPDQKYTQITGYSNGKIN